jgi:hypothetical protein
MLHYFRYIVVSIYYKVQAIYKLVKAPQQKFTDNYNER